MRQWGVGAVERTRTVAVAGAVACVGLFLLFSAYASASSGGSWPRNLYVIAGGSSYPSSGSAVAEGLPAVFAPLRLAGPPDENGNLLALGGGEVVRIDPLGRQHILAGRGSGVPVPGSDVTPARKLDLSGATSVAPLPGGAILVGGKSPHAIWRVDEQGQVGRVAGTGADGDSGDGGPALQARFRTPAGLLVLPDGGFLFSDHDRARVRRVTSDGIITTYAGNGRLAA